MTIIIIMVHEVQNNHIPEAILINFLFHLELGFVSFKASLTTFPQLCQLMSFSDVRNTVVIIHNVFQGIKAFPQTLQFGIVTVMKLVHFLKVARN